MRRLALVLHSHVPYVRRNGVWPAGEDLFHQAALESYLPLLGVLERLADRGIREACSVGITPVLAHQMQDAHMRAELEAYCARIELRALRQVANYRDVHADAVKDLAAHFARDARRAAAQLSASGGSVARGFAALERAGVIEILGGPATHPLLPFIGSARLRDTQIETGLIEHERVFGVRPAGAWIPECATDAGVEHELAAHGVRHAVVDPASVSGAAHPVRAGDTGLVLFPRDRPLTDAVWSSSGYPSGRWYRDFHHYDLVGGFKNWRVTRHGASLEEKAPYDPDAGARAAREDAAAWCSAVEARFDRTGATSLVVAFDTELFGHWWYEGPIWLETVIEMLATHRSMRPATLRDVAASVGHPPATTVRAASWGAGSDFRNWCASSTDDLFERRAAAESRAENLWDRRGGTRDQMLRELMLLQSSDWAYMIARDENAGYGRERFEAHADRFDRLAGALERGEPSPEADRLFEIDNCFAALPPQSGT